MKKKILVPIGLLLLSLLLGGCATRTIDEMYSLPRRSARNNNLRSVMESAMAGRTYAAPVSGDNQESVQSADLTGDGREEYLIFTKGEKNEALQILLFRQLSDDTFEHWETIDCKGSSFDQVSYATIDDQPGCELIVGTQLNEKVTKTVSLFSFAKEQAEKIKSMLYIKFVICDLDADGCSELMVIQNGEAEAANGIARLYSYTEGSVQGSVEAKLSVSPEHIRRIAVNKLSSGEPAVYIASSYYESAIITDIFALKNETFSNISQSSEFGTSMQTLRNNYVYAEDIDNDGILEMPGLVSMMYNTTEQTLVRWFAMDVDGLETNKMYTFHNLDDGWYIQLESDWIDRFAAERNGYTYTFYMWNNSYGTAVPVFTVYALTEKDRDMQAAQQNRFALYRGEDVVYAAKLESGSAMYGMTESYLVNNFHLIRQDWKTAES